jgi:hypothetical protein
MHPFPSQRRVMLRAKVKIIYRIPRVPNIGFNGRFAISEQA